MAMNVIMVIRKGTQMSTKEIQQAANKPIKMNGKRLQEIRRYLAGNNLALFGWTLGLRGNPRSRASKVRQWECQERVPEAEATLATIYFHYPDIFDEFKGYPEADS